MSLHNINDPEGVKALLDSLRTSQEWTDAIESSRAVQQPTTQPPAAQTIQRLDSFPAPVSTPGPENALAPASPDSIRPSSVSGDPPSRSTPSVAELLSQLRTSQGLEPTYDAVERPADRTTEQSTSIPPPADHGQADTSRTPAPTPAPQTTSIHASKQQPADYIRALSFQQALPHISRLMEDPHVVEGLSKMKEEQDKLEKRLWAEREDIRRSHEEKVKIAKNKAKLIGVGLSQQEAQLMSDAFRTELRRFDAERALPAWDGLVRSQQARLEALKVPTMFVTDDAHDAEKQLRVAHVLEGILSTSSPAQ